MNTSDCYMFLFEDFYYIQAFYSVANIDDVINIFENLIGDIISNYDHSYLHCVNDFDEIASDHNYLNMNYVVAIESQGDSIFPGKASLIELNTRLNLDEMSKLSTDGNFIIFGNGDILKFMKFIENKNLKRSDLLRIIIKYDFNVISFIDYFSFIMVFKNEDLGKKYFQECSKNIQTIEEWVVNLSTPDNERF